MEGSLKYHNMIMGGWEPTISLIHPHPHPILDSATASTFLYEEKKKSLSTMYMVPCREIYLFIFVQWFYSKVTLLKVHLYTYYVKYHNGFIALT